MKILGTNFFGHNSSIFLIDTKKKEIFAISTERCTRIKHDASDIQVLINEFKIKEIDFIAQGYENYDYSRIDNISRFDLLIARVIRKIMKPKYVKDLHYSKLLLIKKILVNIFKNFKLVFDLFYLKILKNLKKISKENYFIDPLFVQRFIGDTFKEPNLKKIKQYNHHLCHAASSYYFSPFNNNKEQSLCLVLDGYGDHAFCSLWVCKKSEGEESAGGGGGGIEKTINNLKLLNKSYSKIISVNRKFFFTSVGFIYSNFTQALGFLPNSDEGKVESLAAYSTEAKSYLYNQLIESTLITNEGIDFDIEKVKKFYDKNFLKEQISLLGKENFSGAVQTWLEDTVVSYLNLIHDKNKINNLCLSGGVTSNIKLNLQIYERTPFKNLYIFPAMGDEGVAAGAAILNAIENKEDISWLSKIEVPYFGDVISKESIFKELTKHKNLDYIDLGDNWVRHAAVSLMEKKIIAIVHGKMEFGPRALGNRSILANPLDRKSRDKLNQKIKKRDNFQPFCPSILEEERNRFFKHSFKNKTMTSAFRMFPQYQNKLSSAIHIDGTARPQFVEEIDNKSFYGILKHFKELSGFGILINTSFNLHGRTIVRTAEEALTDFKDCDIDLLYLEGILIKRKDL